MKKKEFENSCGKTKGCDTQEYILPHGGTYEDQVRHTNESLGETVENDKGAGHREQSADLYKGAGKY